MDTNSIFQQEILLMTGTTFSIRQWCEKDTTNQKKFTEKEQLENACWNGLLQTLLPEIFVKTEEDKNLSLMEIREGLSFIELEMGEPQEEMDKYFSIDPYSFMHLRGMS